MITTRRVLLAVNCQTRRLFQSNVYFLRDTNGAILEKVQNYPDAFKDQVTAVHLLRESDKFVC